MKVLFASACILLSTNTSLNAQIPDPGFTIDAQTAIVITDPQNDFLSPQGVTWGVVGQSIQEHHTVENLEKLFKTAQQKGIDVFLSPHYYFPHDHNWKIEGAGEMLMHAIIKMFDRKDALNTEGFSNSGADRLEQYKKYIVRQKNVIVCSPHKIFGPESNDLALQLRKHGYSKILLAGMSANLCVDAHMRELIENGFKVAVIKDATAGTIIPKEMLDGKTGIDGYQAAMANFRLISSHIFNTEEVIQALKKSSKINRLIT